MEQQYKLKTVVIYDKILWYGHDRDSKIIIIFINIFTKLLFGLFEP